MSKQLNYKPQQKFEVIQYPGRVNNPERMIETLGGITKISRVFCDEEKRLELRFHPDNPYNKPVYGDVVNHTGILLSVKVRRKKQKKTKNGKEDHTRAAQHFVRVLGHCSQMYSFDTLCDFQYLPLWREPSTSNSTLRCILDEMQPREVNDLDYFSRTDVPFFSLPELFARVDLVYGGNFRIDPQEDGQSDILGILQKYTYESFDSVVFNMNDVFPTKADAHVVKRMRIKYVSDEQFQCVKKLFDECPIWTRVALVYKSGLKNDKLKCITPSIAYYFTTGPWRTLYVRFGYDPRKDFASRYYQTFDFRLRFGSGVLDFVYSRRDIMKQKQSNNILSEETAALRELVQDIDYPYLDEHKLPRSRQCILRYCDVHIDKIQDMIEKIPSPLTGAKCNEVTGWLPPYFDAQVRQLICGNIKELLRNHYRKEQLTAEVEAVGDETGVDEDDEETQEYDEGVADDDETLELLDDETVCSGNIMDKNIESLFNTITSDGEG